MFLSPEGAEGHLNMVIQKTTPIVGLNVLRTGAGGQIGAAPYITMRHASSPLLTWRIKKKQQDITIGNSSYFKGQLDELRC